MKIRLSILTLSLLSTFFLFAGGPAGCGGGGTGSNDPTPSGAVCGNNIIEGTEACDGTSLANAMCNSLGLGTGSVTCSVDCKSFVTTACVPVDTGICGDGQINPGSGETCDGSFLANTACSSLGLGTGSVTCSVDCKSFVTTACVPTQNSSCQAGTNQTCYTGPSGTAGVGICQSGTQTCLQDGSAFGTCSGEVLPAVEACSDAVDNDCDGAVDSLDSDCLPQPPSNVTAQTGSSQATLSWNATPNATGYNIYIASQPGVTPLNYSSLTDGAQYLGVSSPYVLNSLATGKIYYLVVAAVNIQGIGPPSSEISLRLHMTAVSVAVGANHACVLISGGSIKCWGRDDFGQLGDGGTNKDSLALVDVFGITNAVKISAGGSHTCAILNDGSVQCWGSDAAGQLGDGGGNINSGSPVDVVGMKATDIATGLAHTCALILDGTVKCWGSDGSGQLGDNGANTNSDSPVSVSGILPSEAVGITVGRDHSCALTANHTIKCWGDNAFDQLGNLDPNHSDSAVPVDVVEITSAIAVDSASRHTCALLSDATTKCWGSNNSGQLGNNDISVTQSGKPLDGTLINSATSLAVGYTTTCVLLADTTVQCWGSDALGQLGDGDPQKDSLVPVTVTFSTTTTSVSAGGTYSCVVLPGDAMGNTLKCWGTLSTSNLQNFLFSTSIVPITGF